MKVNNFVGLLLCNFKQSFEVIDNKSINKNKKKVFY